MIAWETLHNFMQHYFSSNNAVQSKRRHLSFWNDCLTSEPFVKSSKSHSVIYMQSMIISMIMIININQHLNENIYPQNILNISITFNKHSKRKSTQCKKAFVYISWYNIMIRYYLCMYISLSWMYDSLTRGTLGFNSHPIISDQTRTC